MRDICRSINLFSCYVCIRYLRLRWPHTIYWKNCVRFVSATCNLYDHLFFFKICEVVIKIGYGHLFLELRKLKLKETKHHLIGRDYRSVLKTNAVLLQSPCWIAHVEENDWLGGHIERGLRNTRSCSFENLLSASLRSIPFWWMLFSCLWLKVANLYSSVGSVKWKVCLFPNWTNQFYFSVGTNGDLEFTGIPLFPNPCKLDKSSLAL